MEFVLRFVLDPAFSRKFLRKAKSVISINKINGFDAVYDTWSYPLIWPIFQLGLIAYSFITPPAPTTGGGYGQRTENRRALNRAAHNRKFGSRVAEAMRLPNLIVSVRLHSESRHQQTNFPFMTSYEKSFKMSL
jgi:hypothetical protein